VPVPSQESEGSCICVLWIPSVTLSPTFLLDYEKCSDNVVLFSFHPTLGVCLSSKKTCDHHLIHVVSIGNGLQEQLLY